MRSTGAERPVVAMKVLYWAGAKGSPYAVREVGATGDGRTLMDRTKPFPISKRQVWEAWKKVKGLCCKVRLVGDLSA